MDTKVKDLSLGANLALFLFMLVAFAAHVASEVYVLRRLWALSVEPVFHLPVPSALTMILLSLFVGQLRWKPKTKTEKREQTLGDMLAFAGATVVVPWVTFVMAKAAIWLLG